MTLRGLITPPTTESVQAARVALACIGACGKALTKPEVEAKVTLKTYAEYLNAITVTLNHLLDLDAIGDLTQGSLAEADRNETRRTIELTNGSCVTLILETA